MISTGFSEAIAERLAAEHAPLAARWFSRLHDLLPFEPNEVFPSDRLLDHIPSLIVGPLDRAVFQPYEIRRTKHERLADATHGFWKEVGDRVALNPTRVLVGSVAVLLVMCAGLLFFSTDLTTNDSYRTKVESVEGQELLSKSFPSGASAPTDVIVPDRADTTTHRSS